MQRNTSLDVVKGLCVLGMLIHHCLNYFPIPNVGLKYAHFVSGAFPFLAGFIITHITVIKYDPTTLAGRVGRRLLFRGTRLLTLCCLLNVLLGSVLGKEAKLKFGNLPDDLATLFLTGTNREVFFSLLIPISYVIGGLGILCLLRTLRAIPVGLLVAILFAYSCWFELGYYSTYFAVGLVGAMLGFVSVDRLDHLSQNFWLVGSVYLVSFLAITFFQQPFPLYALSVTATLWLMYVVANRITTVVWLSRHLLLWGRYSLILYLTQICVLFVFKKLSYSIGGSMGTNLALSFCLTCVLQSVFCFAFDWLRSRSVPFNVGYQLFFA